MPASLCGGRFTVLGELGRGAMAIVLRARDGARGSEIALKLLLPGQAPQVRAVFEHEFHTLAGLKHPAIVEAYEYGTSEAGPYYTMELLDGRDFRDVAPMPYREACQHLREVASALALLHSRKLLHRDISARNVRLTAGGRVKVVDFGALSTFGWASELVGTPPFVAPEKMWGSPLDQRSDLYALGALSYWLLCGRHAYPARDFEQLPPAWQTPPPPPSTLAPDVPPELDTLVMSLLRGDPLARPSSAEAVMDAFGAAAGLTSPERHDETEGYVASAALVGRDGEQRQLSARLRHSLDGSGSTVLVEGEAGLGKSRLLDWVAVEAQVGGAHVVRVAAEAGAPALGVAAVVAVSLLRSLPGAAGRAAASHAPVLARLSEDVRRKLGDVTPAVLPPVELRAALQDALLTWILALADEHPLVLAVDDLQFADEQSLALLAALSRAARAHALLLVVTRERGASGEVEPPPLASLRRSAATLKLGTLSPADNDALVRSILGDVEHRSRFARALHERSAGIPAQAVALVRRAIADGVLTYTDGVWMVPRDVSASQLRGGVEELLQAQLSGLGAGARRLAEAVAVAGASATLERVLWLSEGEPEDAVFRALDELVGAGVLVGEPGRYRFSHEAQRRALVVSVGDERRRAIHLELAARLGSSGPDDPVTRLEAGVHLMRGGQESRGADALVRVGLDRELPREHAERAVPALVDALGVYDRERRSDYEVAAALLPLMSLAYYVDPRLVLAHGSRAIALGLRLTGLARARRLQPYLGARIALIVALVIAGIGFARARRRVGARTGVVYSLRDAIVLLCTVGPAVVGCSVFYVDVDRAAQQADWLRPLAFFGKDHIGAILHEFCSDMVRLLHSDPDCEDGVRRRAPLLAGPGRVPGLAEASRPAMSAGNLLLLGIVQSCRGERVALETADAVDALGVKMNATVGNQIRMMCHMFRGELRETLLARERLEVDALQGGLVWQIEPWVPTVSLVPNLLVGDVVVLRRTTEELAHIAKSMVRVQPYAEVSRGSYLVARGAAAEGAVILEEQSEIFRAARMHGWDAVTGLYALALNAAGEHERAERICRETWESLTPRMRAQTAFNGELTRQRALALSALGRAEEAREQIAEAIRAEADRENPLRLGLLHEAFAEIALREGDTGAFAEHLDAMGRWCRVTEHPTLVAKWERLRDRGRALGVAAGATSPDDGTGGAASPGVPVDVLTDERVPRPERYRRALEAVLERLGAGSGSLFLRGDGTVEVAAACGQLEPPESLRQRVQLTMADAGRSAASADPYSQGPASRSASSGTPTLQFGDRFCRVVPLFAHQDSRIEWVGALAVDVDPDAPLPIDPALVSSLGAAIGRHLARDGAAAVTASTRRIASTGT